MCVDLGRIAVLLQLGLWFGVLLRGEKGLRGTLLGFITAASGRKRQCLVLRAFGSFES